MANVIDFPGAERPAGLNIIGSEELFAPLPPIRWVCRDLVMAPGAPVLFAGYGFSGKTLAAQAMALSVAAGVPCWERHGTEPGRVLHLDYEQGRRLTSERYQRLAHSMGVSPRQLVGRLEVGVIPALTLTPDLCKSIGANRTLVVVDSWRAAHPRVDENSSEVRKSLDAMGAASDATGCTFVVLHHARKPQGDDAPGKYSIRGSGGFYDGSQTVYLFEGSTDACPRVRLARDRLTGRQDEHGFVLRIRDEEGRNGLRVTAEPVPDAPAPESLAELESLVLKTLLAAGIEGIAGADVLALKMGRKAPRVRAAVQSLEADARVMRVKTGRGGGVRLYHHSHQPKGSE